MNQGWIILIGMWLVVTSWVVLSDEFDDLDALQQLNEMDQGLLDFDFDREKEPGWQQNIERELADLEREHLSDIERNEEGSQGVDHGLDEAEELQEAVEALQESIEEESGDIESRDDEQGDVFDPDTGEDDWPEEQDDDLDIDDDQGEDHDDDEDEDDDKKGHGIPDFVLDLLEELGKGDKG